MEGIVSASAGNGKYSVAATAVCCGRDLSVTIIGGTAPHVGAVALGCGVLPDGSKPKFSATVSSLVVLDHKDDFVAGKAAKMLADALQANVSVTCGIDIDNAQKEELLQLSQNADEAMKKLLKVLKKT